MKFLFASDSFKGTLTSEQIIALLTGAAKKVFPDCETVGIPVADGGEGTIDAVISVLHGSVPEVNAHGPLMEEVVSYYGESGDGAAVIEMAVSSGLPMVPVNKRDPRVTTSYGTGELIKTALDRGCRDITIAIGGSATNDGGAGMVQALGAKLCDANGNEIGFGGGSLNTLNDIDISGLDPRLKDCVIRVACDVTNPLVGDSGASRIFGPQKGASEAMIVELDNNLSHYADVIKKALHVDVKDVPGAGAAGGMGAALMAFLGAELKSGIEIVTTALNLEEHIHDCTLVITGEGRIDSQSIHGKVPIGVANVAKKYHKPVIGIAGSLTNDVGVVHQHGIDAVFSVLTSIGTLDEALRGAYDNICRASRNIAATLAIGMRNAG